MQRAREPALADRYAQIVVFTGMMDDVEIPKQTAFVADAMEDVIHEVIDKEQCDPGPPCIRVKLVRRDRVAKLIYIDVCQAEPESPCNARKTDQNIPPRVSF